MTDVAIPVFIVDDDEDVRTSLAQALTLEGFDVSTFDHAQAALDNLQPHWPGVVVSDITMPKIDGLEFLSQVIEMDNDMAVIMLTGHGDISKAVESMKLGAYDFFEKPFSMDKMLDAIKKSHAKRALLLENQRLREEIDAQSGPGPRILGNSVQMKELRRTLMRLKNVEANILISGETGSGKELAARFLHDHSKRCEQPFVTINCGAISDDLIEIELFGQHVDSPGSDQKARVGRLLSAQGGTLFLDEVESMSDDMQLKLLRFMEEKIVQPIGSNESIDLDVRIIAATKVDLMNLAESGHFRLDLVYRLNVLNISIPKLKERVEDIPLLFENFLRISSARYGLAPPRLNPAQLSWLRSHQWPGNVRELRNIAERFVLLGDKSVFNEHSDGTAETINLSLAEQVKRFEKTLLKDTLTECRGHLKKVQRQLNLPRKTLYEKLKRYGLEKSEYKE